MQKIKILLVLLLVSNIIWAQNEPKYFVGTINYDISLIGPNPGSNLQLDFPKQVQMTIKNNKAKVETNLPDGTRGFIIDGDNSTITVLYEFENQPFYIVKTMQDFTFKNAPTIIKLRKKQEVANHQCDVLTVQQKNSKGYDKLQEVCVSRELGENNLYFNTPLISEKGIYLDFIYELNKLPVKLVANNVKSAKVKDKIFSLSRKYKKITEIELNQYQSALYKELRNKNRLKK